MHVVDVCKNDDPMHSMDGTGQGDGSTVLIADSHAGFRTTLKRWIERRSQTHIHVVASVSEAMSILTDVDLDLVFLARALPGGGGSTVLDRVSDTSFDGSIIVISVFDPDDTLSEEDVAVYLTKPIDWTQLDSTLDHYL